MFAQIVFAVAIAFGFELAISCPSFSQTAAQDLAIKVRSQGYECMDPVTATRDVHLSKPDSEVWVLKCRNAIYRAMLHPDMAADITRLKHGR